MSNDLHILLGRKSKQVKLCFDWRMHTLWFSCMHSGSFDEFYYLLKFIYNFSKNFSNDDREEQCLKKISNRT